MSSAEIVKGNSWDSFIPITNEFTCEILSKVVDNKMDKDCARYILLKYFDYMNSDDIPAFVAEKPNEFIVATKREYEEIMVKKLQYAIYLVELLNETDKDKRDKIVNLLSRQRVLPPLGGR